MKPIWRALLAGQVAVAVLFGFDVFDSTRLFERSSRRIRTNTETYDLLREAVTNYSLRMFVAYMVLGVLLAGLLHFGVRLLHPGGREGKRWWLSASGLSVMFVGLGYIHHLYWYPAMYDSFAYVEALVDSVEVHHVNALMADSGTDIARDTFFLV